jgi:hypothetical protein
VSSVSKPGETEMATMRNPTVFNGPVELGLRALMLLAESYPRSLDIQRLVVLDYLVVHSGDLSGGPNSLHPASPLRAGEIAVRGNLIEKGIHLFATKRLLSRVVDEDGISYVAEELAAVFLDAISSRHGKSLRERAAWAVNMTSDLSTPEASSLLSSVIGVWRSDLLMDVNLDEV